MPVTLELDGELATLTISRPERRNALDSATAEEVARHASEVAGRARAVILTGEGDAFCSGGDLDELERWSALSEEQIGELLYGSFQGMIRAIRSSDAVFIAAVNGAAVGAGMDLALACDLRLASSAARFGQVWVRLGVIPGTGGAWLTQALAGPTKAAELLLTGRLAEAEEALAAGLVNEVVEPERLMDRARALAEEVLANPRAGVVENKRALVAASEAALEAALDHARRVQPSRFASDEFRRALERRRRPG